MALTESKLKDLQDKAFDDLYTDHKAVWDGLVTAARNHAQQYITNNAPPRPDDIALALIPMLEVNDVLREHQDLNRAKPRRWVQYFAEYVIDQAVINP